MFDLQAKDGSVRVRKERVHGLDDDEAKESGPKKKQHPLDAEPMVELHKQLLDYYLREINRQSDNRLQMATDEAFYDNDQWENEDVATLEERGQKAIVYNVVSASVDWVTGTEKRGRTDFKVLPRRREDSKPAERKTQLLKYLSDVNKSPHGVSRAFEDAVKAGIGWLEDGYEAETENEPIYSRWESWRNILHDSTALTKDLSDARYICRAKWLDLDIAIGLFPDRAGLLKTSASTDDGIASVNYYGDDAMDEQEETLNDYNYAYGTGQLGFDRPRLRVIEMWHRQIAEIERLHGGVFSGEIFDPYSPGHIEEISKGNAVVRKVRGLRMYVSIFTPAGMLYHGASPYRHNRFPFTPIWGYRRAADGLPYGMVRRVRDIQEDINKRASKALHILSTTKSYIEEGALAKNFSWEDYLEEAARPDALIKLSEGGLKRLQVDADRELSQFQYEAMSRNISMIQQGTGVTDENMGRKTNATSGIAIERRQDQGSLASFHFFDNLLFARQHQGEKQLSLTEQFMTERKAFRITNSRGTPEFVEVNDDLPDNDIIRSKADFLIGEADWQNTMRQAAVTELMNVLKVMPPQVAMVLFDLLIDEMDLKNREEIVKRIRQMTGQTDPDMDPESPEAQQLNQAKDEQQKVQTIAQQAEVDKLVADAAKSAAQAQEILAKARAIEQKIKGEVVTTQKTALDAGRIVTEVPIAADIADHIMHEAGFDSRTDKEAAMAQAEEFARQQQAQQQHVAPPTTPVEPTPV